MKIKHFRNKDGLFKSATETRGTRTFDTHKYAYVKLRRSTNLVLEEKDDISADSHSIMRSLVICTPYPILCGW
jgi:hypothetical protein